MLYDCSTLPGRIAAYFAYDDESLLSPVPFTRGSLFL